MRESPYSEDPGIPIADPHSVTMHSDRSFLKRAGAQMSSSPRKNWLVGREWNAGPRDHERGRASDGPGLTHETL